MGAPVKDRRCEALPLLGAMGTKKNLMRRTKHGVSVISNIRLCYKLLPPASLFYCMPYRGFSGARSIFAYWKPTCRLAGIALILGHITSKHMFYILR